MSIDLTDAIEAGMRELHSLRCCDGEGPLACTPSEMTDDENNAAIAIRAALPHLEQQVREAVAAEIEAAVLAELVDLVHLASGNTWDACALTAALATRIARREGQ